MTRVSAADFKNNIGTYSDVAMSEPVIITSHQRDRLVLMSAEEYRRLVVEGSENSVERRKLVHRRAELHRKTLVELADR